MRRSNSPICALAALQLVGVDGQREVGESVIGGHGRRNLPMPSRRPAKMPRRDRGAALLGAHRADRARRGAAGGSVLARLPGAGLGLGKVLGLAFVTWLVWMGGALDADPVRTAERRAVGRVRVRARAARLRARLGGPPGRRPGRAARVAGPPPLAPARRPACRSPTRSARRLFWAAEAVFAVTFAPPPPRRLLARRLAHREADGHGVPQRRQPRGDVPARGPVVRGRRPQLLLPRPPRDGRARQARRPAPGRGLQRRGRRRCSRSPPPPSSRSPPRSGPRRAGPTRRCGPASARSR